jgi:hypothetical protein
VDNITQPSPIESLFPAEPPKKKSRRTLWIVLGVFAGVIVFCCGGIGTLVTLTTPTNNAHISPTATSAGPTKVPTATTDPQIAEEASYAAAVLPQVATLQNDFGQVGTDCSNQDIVSCRSDLQAVVRDAGLMQTVLNKNPAPACLKLADKQIRAGLVDFKNGAYLAIQGIDNLDAGEINAGSGSISNGSTAFTTATDDLSTAKC